MNNNFENEFQTKDLPLICSLIISGNPVSQTYRNDKEVFFIFNNKNKCEKLADDFYNHKLKVDAYQFSKLLKQVRNFIKDQFQDFKHLENEDNEKCQRGNIKIQL